MEKPGVGGAGRGMMGDVSPLFSFLCLEPFRVKLAEPSFSESWMSAPFNFCRLGMINFTKM